MINPERIRKCCSEDQISIAYFETPVVTDNLVQQTIEEAQLV